MYLPSPLAF